MHRSSPGTVTSLLRDWAQGEPGAADRLLPLVYGELRRIAGARFRQENAGHTLQPTALVHEAYLRLAAQGAVDWQSRSHFLGIAARLMRQILVDHARGRAAAKRGGHLDRVSLPGIEVLPALPPRQTLAVDDALTDLSRLDRRAAAVVELRVFGGLTLEEAAETLGVSRITVCRDWRRARAWLFDRLQPDSTVSQHA